MADTIRERIENAGEAVKDAAKKVGEKVKDGAETVAEKTADAAHSVGQAAKDAGQKLKTVHRITSYNVCYTKLLRVGIRNDLGHGRQLLVLEVQNCRRSKPRVARGRICKLVANFAVRQWGKYFPHWRLLAVGGGAHT